MLDTGRSVSLIHLYKRITRELEKTVVCQDRKKILEQLKFPDLILIRLIFRMSVLIKFIIHVHVPE